MKTASLDGILERAIEEQHIVGAVLAIVYRGEIVYRRAVGHADRETGQSMRLDTLFRLASISKPIVSAAALTLIEQGRLHLDDSLDHWLPEFPAGITIRQLLTHTSGLGYCFWEEAGGPYHRANVSDGLDQPGLSMEENLRRIASCPLVNPPGTAWHYSLGVDVLGAVLSQVCGQPLPRLIAGLVTEPFEMRDTAFRVVDPARLAKPYVDGKPPQPMADPQHMPYPTGAGIVFSPSRAFHEASYPSGGVGMVGSAPDVLRFLEAIRQGPLAREMMRNQTGDFATSVPGWGFGYGGAILLDPAATGTPQSPGTWSWGGVYGHRWFVDPKHEITSVLLTNTAFEGMNGQLPTDIRDAVYALLPAVPLPRGRGLA